MSNKSMASQAMRHKEKDKAGGKPPWLNVGFVAPPEMKVWIETASGLLGWTQGKLLRHLVTFGWAEPEKVFTEKEVAKLSIAPGLTEPVEKEPRPKSEYQQRRDRFPWLVSGVDLTGGDDD